MDAVSKRRSLLDVISLFAGAPFGRWFACLLLLISIFGVLVIAWLPQWVDHVDAPTAALISLALLVPLLVLVLAGVRDVIRFLFTSVSYIWRRFRSAFDRSPEVAGAERVGWKARWDAYANGKRRSMTRGLGTLCLVAAMFTPYLWPDKHGLYEIRTALCLAPAGCEDQKGSRGALADLRPTMREAVETWRLARLNAGHPADKPIPAIIVAASGGASRAAFWLLSSMRMLDEKTNGTFGNYLFAISGVSGGSLGAATYLHMLRNFPRTAKADPAPVLAGVDWAAVRENMDGFQSSDFLVTSIATYFTVDSIWPILRPILWIANADGLLPDRGVAMERAFERHWTDEDRLGIPREQAEAGLIELGRAVTPGCRIYS